jgi:hypothetical protein
MPTSHFTANNHQSASNKMPRQINRNLIFNQIRTRQPISRADLSRSSGLQRSTVSLIVEELLADRWIVEGPTGQIPRGRRPTFLNDRSRRPDPGAGCGGAPGESQESGQCHRGRDPENDRRAS